MKWKGVSQECLDDGQTPVVVYMRDKCKGGKGDISGLGNSQRGESRWLEQTMKDKR